MAAVTDTRGEVKLTFFSGKDEAWPEWALQFCYADLLGWGASLATAAGQPGELDADTYGEEATAIAKNVYALLVSKVGGKAFAIVRLCPRGNGLEAWRRLKA